MPFQRLKGGRLVLLGDLVIMRALARFTVSVSTLSTRETVANRQGESAHNFFCSQTNRPEN